MRWAAVYTRSICYACPKANHKHAPYIRLISTPPGAAASPPRLVNLGNNWSGPNPYRPTAKKGSISLCCPQACTSILQPPHMLLPATHTAHHADIHQYCIAHVTLHCRGANNHFATAPTKPNRLAMARSTEIKLLHCMTRLIPHPQPWSIHSLHSFNLQ